MRLDWIPSFTKRVIHMSYYRWRHCASLPCWPCSASGPGRREPGSWRPSHCWTATLWRAETWLCSTTSSTLAQGNSVGKWVVVQLLSLAINKIYILILTCNQYYIQSFMSCQWSLANIRPIHLIGWSIWNVTRRLQPKYFNVNTVKQRLSWNQDFIKVFSAVNNPSKQLMQPICYVDEWTQDANMLINSCMG